MSTTHQIGIRRVDNITGYTVAHPEDGTTLHLLDIQFPNGDILDHLALRQAQISDLIAKLRKLERAGFDSEWTHG